VFEFESSLGIRRNLKVTFFIPNNFSNPEIYSIDMVLRLIKFFKEEYIE